MAPVNTGIKTGLVLKEKSRASFGSFGLCLSTAIKPQLGIHRVFPGNATRSKDRRGG